jgi:chaperone required for assembly of F1-ATPase
MGTRGPKSSADRSVATLMPDVSVVHRPDAPYDLTDEQATEWRAIVDRLPADWFPRETHGLLSAYCRHVVAQRRVAQLVQNCEAAAVLDTEEYDRLLKMQDREGRAISSLATRMRLSQGATSDPKKKKGKAGNTPPPWASIDGKP